MSAQWKRPFHVVNKVNDVNCKINVGGWWGVVTYHVNLLRPCNRAALLAGTENEIVCLRHIVVGGSNKPDFSKLKPMEDFKLPLTKKDLRLFLRLLGYYLQYIKKLCRNYSSIDFSQFFFSDFQLFGLSTTEET
jgi:hypothetical protein